jgi:hypothetical protein
MLEVRRPFLFHGAKHLRRVPASVPVFGTRPHQIGDQPGNHFAEHSTRKTAISLAAFSEAAFGLPLFFWWSGLANTLRAAS